MIQIASSISGKPCQASLEAVRELLAKNHVDDIILDVKQNGNRDRKKELPVWIPLAASFKNGTRKADDAVPSGLYFLDIDEKGLTEQLWNKVREEKLIEEFRIVYFAESAGGGTHIWAWRTPGLSIEEDIQRLATRLGVSYDSHVTDLARCCFMVSEQYVKLLDESIFEAPSHLPQLGEASKADELTKEQGEVSTNGQLETGTQECSMFNDQCSMSYKGIPFDKIVRLLLFQLGYGDRPADGERNNALYRMTRYLRFICDFNAEWIYQILPHWELPDHEVRATIKSGVNSTRPNDQPEELTKVIELLQASAEAEETSETMTTEEENALLPAVPTDLPPVIRQTIEHIPDEFKEGAILSQLPMLGTLATGIRARYRDGKMQSPSFIVSVWAPQATGKSFVGDLKNLLLDPVIKQDEVEWEKEMQYSLATGKKGEEMEDPMAQIRIIEPNIGVSAFLKRAICAKGKHLFTYTPEVETVTKNNKAGAWSQKNDLFRIAYDNEEWGQHRISKDSFSGKTRLYYQLLMCGTPNTQRAFFSDVESGLVGRVIHVSLPDMMGARMPKFTPWTKEQEDEVKRLCMDLMDETGEMELPLINKALDDWDEQKRQEYLETLRPSLDIFRRRAALNGFRAGMLAYVLYGRQETEGAIKFAVWVAERTLHYQMELFGSRLDALHNTNVMEGGIVRNVKYLEQLSQEFTKEEFSALRVANHQSADVRCVIHRWVKEGKIVKIGRNLWRKRQ